MRSEQLEIDLTTSPEPPRWLRWWCLSTICPDCRRQPTEPFWSPVERRWITPWPHEVTCPTQVTPFVIREPLPVLLEGGAA